MPQTASIRLKDVRTILTRFRRRYSFGTFAVLLAAISVFAAPPQNNKRQGPRAIAVVRWQPDANGNAVPVLIPVAILIEGKIYDAGLYRPSPRPFALEPGTLYEAQDKGELLGYFTVENSTKNQNGAPWVGLGKWKDDAPGLEFDPKQAKPEAPRQAHSVEDTVPVPDDGTPKNKKTKTVYDENGKPIEHPEDDKDEPERDKHGNPKPLERLPQVAKDKPKPAPAPTTPDEDPDRPKIKRGAPTPQTKTIAATPPPADNDPNRPILKRSSGEQKKDKAEASAGGPVPFRVKQRAASVGQNGPVYNVVAISDADVSGNPNDYRFRASDDERAELMEKMKALAQKELDIAMKRPAPVGKTRARAAKSNASAWEDVRFDAFDLDSNNSAELVFSGKQMIDNTPQYVTVVARTDVNGNPRRLFTRTTTDAKLDVLPRLELVDAVDLDRKGGAELLFREIGAGGSDFIIYQVGPDSLEPVFKGAAAD